MNIHLVIGYIILAVLVALACAELGTNGKLNEWLRSWMPRWTRDPLSAILVVLVGAAFVMIVWGLCDISAKVNEQRIRGCKECNCSTRIDSSESDHTLSLTE